MCRCQVSVAELHPDNQTPIVELAGCQPAVIPPLGETASITSVHAFETLGAVSDFIDLHVTIITRSGRV
jgi:hypothetical protein